MSERKKYWSSLEEWARDPQVIAEAKDEFRELLPLGLGAPVEPDGVSRRDFFRAMGLSASAALAACSRAPRRSIVPQQVAAEDLVPGVATYYASVCGACDAACGTLCKTRDGRPIKMEGNAHHPLSNGGLCALGQASVLSLYDAARAKHPEAKSANVAWQSLDAQIIEKLKSITQAGKALFLVTPRRFGPSAEAATASFLAAFPTMKRVTHDPQNISAIAATHQQTHGLRAVPQFNFDRAQLVVSFNADFLGAWLSPVAFTRAYTKLRNPSAGQMSRHYQIESNLSITGSNADVRWSAPPSEMIPILRTIAFRLGAVDSPGASAFPKENIDRLIEDLKANPGQSLVLCDSPDLPAHALTALINEKLGNYGKTLSLDDAPVDPDGLSIDQLIDQLRGGQAGGVIFLGTNPVYDHPKGAELERLLSALELTVSTADRRDETAAAVTFLAPDDNSFESWNDAEPVRGLASVAQPMISPLYETRSQFESLLVWSGSKQTYYDFIRARWQREVLSGCAGGFESAWRQALTDGFARFQPPSRPQARFQEDAAKTLAQRAPHKIDGELELALYATALREGKYANNGWLLELPDPISKVTWTNVAQLAPTTGARLGLKDGDRVSLESNGKKIELPVLLQPGVNPKVVAIAMGYGRTQAGPLANGLGANAFRLAGATGIALKQLAGSTKLARTQSHFSEENRDLIHAVSLEELLKNPHAGGAPQEPARTMWAAHEYAGHRWGMAIDLSTCTGCSACLVACQSENNVPVVGVDEVRRGREMHWLRIDRYYAGSPDAPEVVHQPMLCQHCENAPCETVCPVLATVHSSEGLNQQIYNRCVGTRYCANNCPTKVRRFNWFDYDHGEPVERLVLNPDVVVRSRGVMEKCSFCSQRIQAAKANGRAADQPVVDGDIKTACEQSCPANALVFGDLNDPKSRVSRAKALGRSYRILEETNIESSIHYLARVRNAGKKEDPHG